MGVPEMDSYIYEGVYSRLILNRTEPGNRE
jgi:hypothetical protein